MIGYSISLAISVKRLMKESIQTVRVINFTVQILYVGNITIYICTKVIKSRYGDDFDFPELISLSRLVAKYFILIHSPHQAIVYVWTLKHLLIL